jgi:tetratricopeptide (TPR) repeat protein
MQMRPAERHYLEEPIIVADRPPDNPNLPQGYRDVPPEDRKKAEVFFQRGRTVADTGNFDYAIEMFLQGLNIDPESMEAHQTLREISLRRKASGGKRLGMLEAMKIGRAGKDDKEIMLNAEKLLAYDPGNTDHMLTVLRSAHRAGYYDTVLWIGPILQKANSELPEKKQDANKFLALKDIYKDIGQYKLATDACQLAVILRPDDMDLQTELKNLGAQHSMAEGKYGVAKSFRESVRDMTSQRDLLDRDKDIRSDDVLMRQIAQAEAEWEADRDEPGKIMKLVEALVRTENPEYESRAIDLLQSSFERTRQFRFRLNIGRIKMAQMSRTERALRDRVRKNKDDEAVIQEYKQFLRDKTEEELKEFELWAENYPTDLSFRFEMARRLFMLQRFGEAIPVFQQARQDPKYRNEAGLHLGRAFLEAGFIEEAVDTFRDLIESYPVKGDDRSKEMYYWYGMALEQAAQKPAALKCYSQVAQWDFKYRDVQERIKRLRSSPPPPGDQPDRDRPLTYSPGS